MDEDLYDILCAVVALGGVDVKDFEHTLAEYGYMIVPIEDPTNLRYGVDE